MVKARAQKGSERPASPPAARKPLSRQMRLYQHIAVSFVVITFLLLLGVLYLSVSRATIRIVPNPKEVSAQNTIEIVPGEPSEGQLAGVARTTTVEKSRVFTLPAEGAKEVEGKASGYVTLINKSSGSQPLVVNTRLLSEKGVLFRIQDYVVIPANGEVEVLVKADQPGKDGEIEASKFTVPGLPVSAQEVIYAVSTEPMTGGVQYVRALTEQDISNAEAELETELLVEAKDKLAEGVDRQRFNGEKFDLEVLSKSSDVPAGQETGSFSVTMKVEIQGVWFPNSELITLSGNSLAAEVKDGFRLSSVNEAPEVNIRNIDGTAGTATLIVALKGVSVISETAQALDKDRFVGRAPHEVLTLLRSSEAIKDVSLVFTPFWLKRVPTLKDHIKIIIEEPKQ